MTMRDLITICEAKTPKSAKPMVSKQPSPADVAAKCRAVWAKVASADWTFRQQVSKAWGEEFIAVLKSKRATHEADQAEEAKEAEEYGESFTPSPFNMRDAAPDALLEWWQSKSDLVDAMDLDLRHAEHEYFLSNPRTEASDAIDLMRSEKQLVNRIKYHGGLNDLRDMDRTLDAIDDYAEDVNRYWSGVSSAFSVATESVTTFLTHFACLILTYCKLVG